MLSSFLPAACREAAGVAFVARSMRSGYRQRSASRCRRPDDIRPVLRVRGAARRDLRTHCARADDDLRRDGRHQLRARGTDGGRDVRGVGLRTPQASRRFSPSRSPSCCCSSSVSSSRSVDDRTDHRRATGEPADRHLRRSVDPHQRCRDRLRLRPATARARPRLPRNLRRVRSAGAAVRAHHRARRALSGTWLFLQRTMLGRAIRGTADNRDGAQYVGIDVPGSTRSPSGSVPRWRDSRVQLSRCSSRSRRALGDQYPDKRVRRGRAGRARILSPARSSAGSSSALSRCSARRTWAAPPTRS